MHLASPCACCVLRTIFPSVFWTVCACCVRSSSSSSSSVRCRKHVYKRVAPPACPRCPLRYNLQVPLANCAFGPMLWRRSCVSVSFSESLPLISQSFSKCSTFCLELVDFVIRLVSALEPCPFWLLSLFNLIYRPIYRLDLHMQKNTGLKKSLFSEFWNKL